MAIKDINQRSSKMDTINSKADKILSSEISASKPSQSYINSNLPSNHTHDNQPILSPNQEEDLIRYNHITYLLYALSFFTAGLLWIFPIIMNYARRKNAEGTWLATHFDWQIKTFWYSIIIAFIGLILVLVGLGGFSSGFISGNTDIAFGSTGIAIFGGLIMLFAVLWHIYRIVRGWIALSDRRPIP